MSGTASEVCGDHVVIQFGYRAGTGPVWDGRVDEGRAITVVCERRPHRKGDHRRGKVRWTHPGGTKVWLR